MREKIFGTAYYPEYMPYDRIETDLSWMKEAGINVIRLAESTWSTWEPREGVFDFSILEKTLKACEKEGMRVIIGTPTYAVPSWLVKKDPTIMVEGMDGSRSLYGPRQQMDILNPTYRFYAQRVIRKLLELVKDSPCVIGYQLDNETKYYGCASAHFRQGFVEYLQGKFGSVEQMNQAYGLAYWSNRIDRWEDFPDPRGTINASIGCAFDEYRRRVAAEFLGWQREIVEQYRREDQFVTQNFDFEWRVIDDVAVMGCSYGVQSGINHYEASKAVTIAGVDIYHPTQEALTGEEIAFGGDSIRSLKEAPYLVLETQAQGFHCWTPFPGQLTCQAISHLASGAAGMMYWNWHSLHNSFETYWKGILSHDLEKNRVYEEVKEIGEKFKILSPVLEGYLPQTKVAIVVDNVSMDAMRWFPIDQAYTYNDLVRSYYRAFYNNNISCDVIDVQALLTKEKGRYSLLVTPALYAVSEEMVAYLTSFVAAGGTLLSSFRSFVSDRNLKVYPDRLPHHMGDVFGVTYQEATRPGTTTVAGREVRYFQELLMPKEDTKVWHRYEHPYWDAYAAVTEHGYKKGVAFYVGALVEEEVLSSIAVQAARRAGVEVPKEHWPLVLRSGRNKVGQWVTFVMNYSDISRSFPWTGEAVRDLLSEESISHGEAVTVHPWGCKVLA